MAKLKLNEWDIFYIFAWVRMRFLEWQTETEEEKVSLITVFLDAWAFLWSFVHNIIFIFNGIFFLFFSFLCHFSKCAQNIHYFVVIIFSRNWTLLFDCDVTIDVVCVFVCVCRRIDKSKWQERNQELSASEQNEDSFIHRQRTGKRISMENSNEQTFPINYLRLCLCGG